MHSAMLQPHLSIAHLINLGVLKLSSPSVLAAFVLCIKAVSRVASAGMKRNKKAAVMHNMLEQSDVNRESKRAKIFIHFVSNLLSF